MYNYDKLLNYIHMYNYNKHSSIQDFLIKKFSVYSPIEPWHKMTTRLGLLRHLSSNEDGNRCGVCPHADHENLSFIVRVIYKYVLCCFVIFSSLAIYVEYFNT